MFRWIRALRAKFESVQYPEGVVADLDAMLVKPVHFRLQGRIHTIPPINLETFTKASNVFAFCNEAIRSKQRLNESKLLDAYSAVFEVMCPTITRRVLESMGIQQIGAAYNLVLEAYMGKAQVEAQKKSSPKPMTP